MAEAFFFCIDHMQFSECLESETARVCLFISEQDIGSWFENYSECLMHYVRHELQDRELGLEGIY